MALFYSLQVPDLGTQACDKFSRLVGANEERLFFWYANNLHGPVQFLFSFTPEFRFSVIVADSQQFHRRDVVIEYTPKDQMRQDKPGRA